MGRRVRTTADQDTRSYDTAAWSHWGALLTWLALFVFPPQVFFYWSRRW